MKCMEWLRLISNKRLGLEEIHSARKDDRTEFQRDYDRLIFSAPFRRLQNKTQVFPLPGSVFVHNRLTHSLEVSCVGRSLGCNVSKSLIAKHPELADTHVEEIGSIIAAACLAHDLGNPPFGHSGEKAIETYFSEGEGRRFRKELSESEWSDLVHFEGNANAFRLLTHQFCGRRKGGFVMTYSTLASIVKYPFASSLAGGKSKFGFFVSEQNDYECIAEELGIVRLNSSSEPPRYARYPLVYLVEAADDICYQLMDIEDAHKLRLLTTEETKKLFFLFLDEKKKARAKEVFEIVTDINEQIAYLRSTIVGLLIGECTRAFMEHEEEILAGTFTGTLIKCMSLPVREAYETCARTAWSRIYRSKEVLDVELAGYKVISTLLDLMMEAVTSPEKTYSKLLIDRVSEQYDMNSPTLYGKIQAVLDYVSGMTDVFALDLYRKINGGDLPAV